MTLDHRLLCCRDCGSRDLVVAEHRVSPVRYEFTCNVGEWKGRKWFSAWCVCGWRKTGDRDVVAAAAVAHESGFAAQGRLAVEAG